MKLVILDRDGVINEESDNFIKSPEEWIPIAGSLEAIAALNHAGFRVAIATNLSALARELLSIDRLNAIHQKMHRELESVGGHIDAIFFCPHGPNSHCDCRKPKPGMLQQISKRFFTDLEGIPVIGDRMRDLQAAEAAGATPILVRTGKGRETEKECAAESTVAVYDNLSKAVEAILNQIQ